MVYSLHNAKPMPTRLARSLQASKKRAKKEIHLKWLSGMECAIPGIMPKMHIVKR